ncbi:MAG: DMT family transporter [Nitrospirae bacterium]|nr:DMT family transporter [Nitrospirota bacterium]
MWIAYALLTAFMLATCDALTKKALASRDAYFVAWARLFFALPFFIASLFIAGIPKLDYYFWRAALIAVPLEIAAYILYIKSLKASPLSLTMPFLALTPVFVILISYIMLGEKVSAAGGTGILLLAAGGYMLNMHKAGESVLQPFKEILREPGSVMMIAVAFIYSFTASLGKMAIMHSSPAFFGSLYFILITILFTPIAFIKSRESILIKKKDLFPFLMIGMTFFLMIIFHMKAMSLTNVAYMISVKRMSLLISIFYGYLIFRESNIRERALGSLVMFAGFLLIVLNP